MRFRALDGWRGVAALLGVLYHWPLYGHLYPSPIVRNAYLFVDFFFVLSGFVISFGYAERIVGPQSAVTFLLRRLGRLGPLHAVVLALFAGLELLKMAAAGHGLPFRHEPFTGPHSIDALFANLALVHSLGIYDHLTWNGPSWSVSVQFWGYVAFALVMLLRPRHPVAIAIIAGATMAFLIGALSQHVPVNDITYDYGGLRYLLGFCVGHLTYRVYVRRTAATVRQTPSASGGAHGRSLEIPVLVGLAAFVCGAGSGYLTLATPAVFAVVVYVFAAERGVVSRLLQSAPLQCLGRWSYAIYLTHLLVITSTLQALHVVEKAAGIRLLEEGGDLPEGAVALLVPFSGYAMDAVTLGYLAAAIGLAALAYRLVERPARDRSARLAAGLFNRPATGKAATGISQAV